MRRMYIGDLVFGCGPIGSYAADGETTHGRAALEAALEAGITRFDVAPSYGDGEAERLLGDALSEWRARTDPASLRPKRGDPGAAGSADDGPIVVSTKVGRT